MLRSRLLGLSLFFLGCSAVEDVGSSDDALVASPDVLAIGDSITYGWQPDWEPHQHDGTVDESRLQKAVTGRGYAEKAALLLHLNGVANAACPGEASGSFIDAGVRDNGCDAKRIAGLPMQTSWGSAMTQLDFVEHYLADHQPKLITVTLGGNDLFLLQRDCEDNWFGQTTCIAAAATLQPSFLGSPVDAYRRNLETMLERIYAAGYRGTIAMLTTYAMSYSFFSGEPFVIGAFNDALRQAVANASATSPGMTIVVADAYAKMQEHARAADDNACEAGLLLSTLDGKPITDDAGKPSCDRHPSQAGHQVLAEAVAEAVAATKR